MGVLRIGLAGHELKPIVDAWRAANTYIAQLWADGAASASPDLPRRAVRLRHLSYSVESGILFSIVPSSRRLGYLKPRLGENHWGGTSFTYNGATVRRE